MRRCLRAEVPEPLTERAAGWTERWIGNQARGGAFRWPQYLGLPLNQLLLPPLLDMTHQRCAYCDGSLGVTSRETIDHFRSKSEHPGDAFLWTNLFAACDLCQSEKGSVWNEQLLKPDVDGYRFTRYFVCDSETGTLEPNPAASPADRERAAETIRILGLNEAKRPIMRARIWKSYRRDGEGADVEDYDYRFFIEALGVEPSETAE